MSEYIKREDAIKSLKESKDRHPSFSGEACAFIIAIQKIKNLHSADVVEVKHGKWELKTVRGKSELYCSVCGNSPGILYKYRFCPNCNTKMDLED